MDLDDYEAPTGRKRLVAEVGTTTGELPSDVWASRLIDGLEAAPEGEPAEDDEAAWAAALAAARARAEDGTSPEVEDATDDQIPVTVGAPVAHVGDAASALQAAHGGHVSQSADIAFAPHAAAGQWAPGAGGAVAQSADIDLSAAYAPVADADHAAGAAYAPAAGAAYQHADGAAPEHAGGAAHEHAAGVAYQHAGSAAYEHADGVAPEHAGDAAHEHAAGVAYQHAGSAAYEHADGVAPEHAGDAASEHAAGAAYRHAAGGVTAPQSADIADGAAYAQARNIAYGHGTGGVAAAQSADIADGAAYAQAPNIAYGHGTDGVAAAQSADIADGAAYAQAPNVAYERGTDGVAVAQSAVIAAAGVADARPVGAREHLARDGAGATSPSTRIADSAALAPHSGLAREHSADIAEESSYVQHSGPRTPASLPTDSIEHAAPDADAAGASSAQSADGVVPAAEQTLQGLGDPSVLVDLTGLNTPDVATDVMRAAAPPSRGEVAGAAAVGAPVHVADADWAVEPASPLVDLAAAPESATVVEAFHVEPFHDIEVPAEAERCAIAPVIEGLAEMRHAPSAEPTATPAPSPAATDVDEMTPVAERLRAGRLVLCAGPRLTAGQLGLRDALARLLALLPADEAGEARALVETRPLVAAGWLRRRLGEGFAAALAALVVGVDASGERLRKVAALPFRAIVTTAWDDALDRALAAAGMPRPAYTARDAAALAGEPGPFVLHLFGDARRPDTLVATHDELGALLGEARGAAQELFRARCFLFVGFEARDLELELLLERVLLGANGEHFAVLPDAGAVERDELRAAWGVRVLDEPDADRALAALQAALAAQPAPVEPAHDDVDGWLALLAAKPNDPGAAFALDRLAVELREKGEHERLVELLLGRVAIEPQSARRAEMLLTVARLFEHEADDAERALTALLAAYKEEPAQAAWYELERLAHATNGWDDVLRELGTAVHALPAAVRVPLWRRLERWSELVRALDDVAHAGGPDAQAHAIEAAQLTAERLRDRSGAIGRIEMLLRAAPHDRLLLGLLERLHEDAGNTTDWLHTLARQADATDDPATRGALYRKLALAWELENDGSTRAGHFWYLLLGLEPNAGDALRALEKLHREQREWVALGDIQARQAGLLSGRAAADAWVALAGLREHELCDIDGAIVAFQHAVEADGEHAGALAELTRLYDATGAWHLTVELLERQARKSNDFAEQAELFHRAGELAAVRLGDATRAEAYFTRVLELEPTHVAALTALAALHERSGAKLRAAKLLVEAVAHTGNRLERTRLSFAAGRLYEELENTATATELYLSALGLDPEHVDAGSRVADLLWKAERWEELVPVLEMLTRKPAEPAQQVERLLRLARAARNVGQDEKVPRAYARAAELDVTHREAQRGHANHLMAAGQWEPALRALERLFQHHVDRMSVAERAALFADLATCELSLGARQSAREFVASALDVDPTHRPSLLLQAELAGDEPAALVEAKRALVVGADADEQVRLLGEIGDLYRDRLRDNDRAVGAWAEALELRPRDHKLLHKCLDAYVADKAWPQALEMLERLIAAESVDTVRAKYRHAAALICRDELAQSETAVAHLKAALDDDPQLDRSAVALEPLLTQRQDWVELARLYRRKLKQLGPESPDDADRKNGERLRVWTALGELCLEKLNEPETARAALEVALALDRGNHERHKRFADVCVQAHAFEQAIVEHQLVLAREKNRILSFRALKHLYIQTHEREKSIACSYALTFLRKGEPDDVARVADHKRLPFATTRRVLGDDGWARVVHPDEDRLLDHLFAIVGPTVVAGQAQPHKAFGLVRKDAVGSVDRSYAKTLAYVTTILDVAAPEVHVKPEQREPVVFANCIDGRELVPVFILGGPMVAERRREAELVFELARRAAHLRPERLMRLATPHPQTIALVIEAAMALADGSGSGADVVRTAAALERALPAPQLEQVRAIGAKLRAANGTTEEAAMGWLRATDLTGSRVGLTLGGDLETCARLLASEGQPAGTAAPTERLLDLTWSSVTEEMFMVRRLLGLPL